MSSRSKQAAITFVSTELPPGVCGVGSHTARLRDLWPGQGRILNVVSKGAAESAAFYQADDFVEFGPSAQSVYNALEKAEADQLFLQYAGRAYGKWGAPWWFYVGVKKWRKRHPEKVLLLYLHELWADLKVTHRQFLFERLSRWMVGQLMDMADVVVTNTEHHRDRLLGLRPDSRPLISPVGTNIRPDHPPKKLSERRTKDFVLFGLPYGRLHGLKLFGQFLEKWHREGAMEKLHVIGPMEERWLPDEEQRLSVLPPGVVQRHGPLPEKEVSAILKESGFGMLAQPAESMTKSGGLMAYASHGCVVISPHAGTDKAEPLRFFVHPEEISASAEFAAIAQQRQDGLTRWHDEHASWPKIAQHLAEAMNAAKHA